MEKNIGVYDAIMTCKNTKELEEMIRELLAPQEVERMEFRWKIAHGKIENNASVRKTQREFNASQELVRRVFASLEKPKSSMKLAYERLVRKKTGS